MSPKLFYIFIMVPMLGLLGFGAARRAGAIGAGPWISGMGWATAMAAILLVFGPLLPEPPRRFDNPGGYRAGLADVVLMVSAMALGIVANAAPRLFVPRRWRGD